MNLFDKLVDEALRNEPQSATLRTVVEKEILHHDILRIFSENDLLRSLTFIGGTCLRYCYGGTRLSEDLHFTCGTDFTRKSLSDIGHLIIENIYQKYRFAVRVSEPIHDKGNVDTWKIRIETRAVQKHLPAQRINIDICAVPSYDTKPMVLLNTYGIDMGTSGLIIQAQSKEEIYTDKLLAFALRPNRIKYRDLWDIAWLHRTGIKPKIQLLADKLHDRKCSQEHFLKAFDERRKSLSTDNKKAQEFNQEMERFLSQEQISQLRKQTNFWHFMVQLLADLEIQIKSNME